MKITDVIEMLVGKMEGSPEFLKGAEAGMKELTKYLRELKQKQEKHN
jgi:hypothetical protein